MWQDVKLLHLLTRILWGIGAFLLLLTILWWGMQLPFFTLKMIQVEGANGATLKHVNAELIRSVAVSKIKGNFFSVNLDAVRQAFEWVPWVKTVTVKRVWPNALAISIDEYVPLGTWGDKGELLSTTGDVFTANLAEAEENRELLSFHGPSGSEKQVLAHYETFKKWFAPFHLWPQAVLYSNRYAWVVKLNNHVEIALGREENDTVLEKRIARLLRIYPELTRRLTGKMARIDLRYPNGFAIKTMHSADAEK